LNPAGISHQGNKSKPGNN